MGRRGAGQREATQAEWRGGPVIVERLIAEGKGFARLPDGRVVLLRGVLPGDEVQPTRARVRGGYVDVETHECLTPSALRRSPACEVAEACGGCGLMALREEDQDRIKRDVLSESLRRIGGLPADLPLAPTVRGPSLGYRDRIRLAVDHGRVGFFAARSHELVVPPRCEVASPPVQAAVQTILRVGSEYPGGLSRFLTVEVRRGSDDTVSLYFGQRPGPTGGNRTEEGALGALRQTFLVATNDREAAEPRLWQRFVPAAGSYLWVPPGCFTQVNWHINQELVGAVLRGVSERRLSSFLDLYAGAGNFALPLWRAGLTGLAAESHPLAPRAARVAMREQGIDSELFLNQDSAGAVLSLLEQGRRFELVVIDPPRSGIDFDVALLRGVATRYVALCSCNGVTLARDLKRLLALGFGIESVQPFEMFPQTHHLEVLVWLRAPASGLDSSPRGPL